MVDLYSYIRFSTLDQRKGDSLRRQNDGIQKLLAEHSGWRLSPLTLRDLGVSAFRGKNAKTGALSRFLDAVEQGQIARGSILAVENLDRLSRADVLDALSLFTSILKAGIEIYTIMDRRHYTEESVNRNPTELMISILVMIRANEESKTKADRIGKAWEKKRDRAVTDHKPATGKCPGWIQLVNGRYELIPDRVGLLKRIIRLSLDGAGCTAITRKLNGEGSLNWSKRSKFWDAATIRMIQRTRTLIGEYQQGKFVKGKWTPAGDAITGYYPAAISEAEFYKMQAALDSRKLKQSGREGSIVNVFGRILRDGTDGSSLVLRHKVDNGTNYIYLTSSLSVKGAKAYVTFPYAAFEKSFLEWVQEIEISRINNQHDGGKIDELKGRAAEISGRIKSVQDAMVDGGELKSLLPVIKQLEAQHEAVEKALSEEQNRKHADKIDTKNIASVIQSLAKATGDQRIALRQRLRSMVQSTVKRIDLYMQSKGMQRIAVAHVMLENGQERFFAVRTGRGLPITTYSDDLLRSACPIKGFSPVYVEMITQFVASSRSTTPKQEFFAVVYPSEAKRPA